MLQPFENGPGMKMPARPNAVPSACLEPLDWSRPWLLTFVDAYVSGPS